MKIGQVLLDILLETLGLFSISLFPLSVQEMRVLRSACCDAEFRLDIGFTDIE